MDIPAPPKSYAIQHPEVLHYAKEWYSAIVADIHSLSDRDSKTISQVSWFKDSAGLEHECLVFTVNAQQPVASEPAYKAFIAVERLGTREPIDAALEAENVPLQTLPDDIVKSMDEVERKTVTGEILAKLREELKLIVARAQRVSNLSKDFSNSVSHSSSKPNQEITAIDQISCLDTKVESEVINKLGMETPVELDTFVFNDTFFLRDLGIILYQLHKSRSYYTLKKYNCYWFAGTLAEILINMKDLTRTSPKRAERAGCMMKFRAFKPDNVQVADLVNAIQAEIRQSDELIEAKWKAGEGGKAESDALLAQERRGRQETEAKLARERQEKERLARELQEKERLAAESAARVKQLEEELRKSQLSAMRTTTH